MFLPSFTLPFSGREYPYGMLTAMMEDLHTNVSMYANNAIIVNSPFNPYMASRFAINNLGQIDQSQGGIGYMLV